MIEVKRGDIFLQDVDALVNPVNCVGIMGKGLALEFKKRYIHMLRLYEDACAYGAISMGKVKIVESGEEKPPYIIFFPTKYHWRDKSYLGPIVSSLQDMDKQCRKLNIRTVALPAVGCGLGGLEWRIVRSVIERELGNSKVHYTVLEPIATIEV